ncbi:MAG: primosomal protein N' [Oscillospiraceae bacterium]|nr:primosomal protein N' [Oscillospiraceae bacterium]
MAKAALVCLEKTTIAFDGLYSYAVPQQLENTLCAGCRVTVPFGRANSHRQGVVVKFEEIEDTTGLKAVISQLDEEPLLNNEMLWMLEILRETSCCTYYDALRVLVPAGIGIKLTTRCSLNRHFDDDGESFTDTQKSILDWLRKKKDWVDISKLAEAFGLTAESPEITELINRGIIFTEEYAKEKIGAKTVSMVRLTAAWEEGEISFSLTPKQSAVVSLLSQVGCADLRELCYLCSVTRGVVDTLVKKGAAELFERTVYRTPSAHTRSTAGEVCLNAQQQAAYDKLSEFMKQGFVTSLLYGVTGSGKTQVFLKLIQKTINDGKNAILLVPEISLTPQTIQLFKQALGEQVGVLHSSLSLGERADEFKRIREGKVRLVVGTRSAVFAPLENIGLIVIDEEQEHTYKSEQSPRYHAKDIARARCRRNNAMLLLASATPSIESFYNAQQGRYELVRMDERYSGATLPDVYIVDMRDCSPGTLLSEELEENIRLNLAKGEQTILLLNRRGHSTVIKCGECGEAAQCPHCSIPLTYHQTNGQLMCHYCGYFVPAVSQCPECGSGYVRYTGMGTQRAQEILEEIFPEASVLRMDTDTTLSKFAHERYFNEFLQGKYDIMIGTQMVAKGHNFPNVTLVGVLNADSSLYSEDFRSFERTFSLITQVVGRSGRGSISGRAIIQTHTPESTVIAQAAAQDYDSFYNEEIAGRELGFYPPYCSIALVGFVGEDQKKVQLSAKRFTAALAQRAKEKYDGIPLRMLGPCEPAINRVAGKYRSKLLLKYRKERRFFKLLREVMEEFGRDKANKGVTFFADPYYDHSM